MLRICCYKSLLCLLHLTYLILSHLIYHINSRNLGQPKKYKMKLKFNFPHICRLILILIKWNYSSSYILFSIWQKRENMDGYDINIGVIMRKDGEHEQNTQYHHFCIQ